MKMRLKCIEIASKSLQGSNETINHGKSTRRKHLAGGFITDMSNGDDCEAIVSTECKNIFRRHGAALLRLKFIQNN
jgi:hypothetical protein